MKKLFVLIITSLVLSQYAQAQSESAGEITTQVPAKTTSAHGFKGSFGLGFTNAKSLSFDNASAKTSSGRGLKGSSEFEIDPAYSLEAGFQNIPAEGWGYSAFLTYDSRIKVSGYNDRYAGTKVSGKFSQKPSLDLLTVSGNAVYGMDNFYFPIGLNVTLPNYESQFSSPTTDIGFGFQFGVGILALDNLAFDLMYKKRTFMLAEKFPDNVAFNYGNGGLEGLSLQGRLLF